MFVRRLVIASALIAGAVQLQVAASESVIRESVNEKKTRSDMSSAAAQLRADAPITTTISSSDIDSLNTKSSSALVFTDESSVPSKLYKTG